MHRKCHFLMSRFHSLLQHTWNLKNAIFWKPLGVTSSNFQDYLVFMMTNNWGKFEENLRGMVDIFNFFWMIWYGITRQQKCLDKTLQVRCLFWTCWMLPLNSKLDPDNDVKLQIWYIRLKRVALECWFRYFV